MIDHRARIRSTHRATAALLALLLTGAACGPGSAGRPPTASADTGSVGPVFRGDFQRELLLTGELEAVRAITINAPQTAIFQMRITFMAEEGTFVRAGDPLLDFDNAALADRVLDLDTQILDAQTQVVAKENEIASTRKDLEIELAEREYDHGRTRLDAAIEEGILSPKEYGNRQLAFARAERELAETREQIGSAAERGQAELDVLTIQRDKLQRDLQSARNDLDLLSIRAPADGLVIYEKRRGSSARFQEGDSCWPGQRVMRLPDLSEMQVGFSVNEVDAPLLEVGMAVEITMDSFPEVRLGGGILRIPSMAVNREDDSQVRVFKVISTLSETRSDLMKPGLSVLGRVVVERRERVPLVLRSEVRFDGERYWLRSAGKAANAPDVEIHPVARNGLHYVLDGDRDRAIIGRLASPSPAEAPDPSPSPEEETS